LTKLEVAPMDGFGENPALFLDLRFPRVVVFATIRHRSFSSFGMG
jgi:hypothetical protein